MWWVALTDVESVKQTLNGVGLRNNQEDLNIILISDWNLNFTGMALHILLFSLI